MKLLDEDQTLDAALAGRSIARFGDGELRLATGGQAISQRKDKRLAEELRRMLVGPTASLVCLPRVDRRFDPKSTHIWTRYMGKPYAKLYQQATYGSTHVTRPDQAVWINRPDYWDKVRRLWAGKLVLLVKGTERSLRVDMLSEARMVVPIGAPRVDAYECVDELEKVILDYPPDCVSILCVGATATVLAERLALVGRQALDLGHLGMMWRRCVAGRIPTWTGS